MKIQLLPSSFGPGGTSTQRQHLACVVVDDRVAFDAGSLAFGCSDLQRDKVRDVILSHVHLDHIAGLPMFIDDLYISLTSPVRIHVTAEMSQALERDVFNWTIYPRFSELANSSGPVLEYINFEAGKSFNAAHLSVVPVLVNHLRPSAGFIVSDGNCSIGITGDTAATEEIWRRLGQTADLRAVLVECAFPNEMADLADRSHHMTPMVLAEELKKFDRPGVPVYVVNIKPMYREAVVLQLIELGLSDLDVLEVGREYEL